MEEEPIMLERANVGPNGMELTIQHPLFHKFAEEMALLISKFPDAKNYLSVIMTHKETGEQFEVIIRRAEGKTPAQKNLELESKIRELEAVQAKLAGELSKLSEHSVDDCDREYWLKDTPEKIIAQARRECGIKEGGV